MLKTGRRKGVGGGGEHYFPGELLNFNEIKELGYSKDIIALFNSGQTHSYRKRLQSVMKHLTLHLALYTLQQAWKKIRIQFKGDTNHCSTI
jgi:hypothetical protein